MIRNKTADILSPTKEPLPSNLVRMEGLFIMVFFVYLSDVYVGSDKRLDQSQDAEDGHHDE